MHKQKLWAHLLVALQLAITVIPTLVVLIWAFADQWAWPQLFPQSWTLRGIHTVIGEAQGLATLGLSVTISLAASALATLAASFAGRAIALYKWRGRSAFQLLTLMPFLIPSTVFAMGVQVILLRMRLAGTVAAVILAHSITALPYAVALMSDVIAAAGTKLEDAARVLGASRAQAFLYVGLPQLVPGLASSFSMSYIISFSQYFLTLLIGAGKVKTFALALFPYISGGDRTIAASYSIVFLACILVVFALFELLLAKLGATKRVQYFEG